MKNVIFGSGLIGLLAKALLPTWTVVPFYKSRFFSLNPAIDDNFLIRHPRLDEFVRDSFKTGPQVITYRRAWSIGGKLVPTFDAGLCQDWLFKVFGSMIPPQCELYFNKRLDSTIYDLRLNQIYQTLLQANLAELQVEASKGIITEIGPHYFIRNGVREDFDNSISTIPLPVLGKLCNVPVDLPARDVFYYHIQTSDLDFEGFNQVLVVDRLFSFYKVTNIGPQRYLFYCYEDLPNPGTYFMAFLRSFDILDGTSVSSAIPQGPIPNLQWCSKLGIECVGSYAQWDWCLDVGSCLLRLLTFTENGFKSKKQALL